MHTKIRIHPLFFELFIISFLYTQQLLNFILVSFQKKIVHRKWSTNNLDLQENILVFKKLKLQISQFIEKSSVIVILLGIQMMKKKHLSYFLSRVLPFNFKCSQHFLTTPAQCNMSCLHAQNMMYFFLFKLKTLHKESNTIS